VKDVNEAIARSRIVVLIVWRLLLSVSDKQQPTDIVNAERRKPRRNPAVNEGVGRERAGEENIRHMEQLEVAVKDINCPSMEIRREEKNIKGIPPNGQTFVNRARHGDGADGFCRVDVGRPAGNRPIFIGKYEATRAGFPAIADGKA